MWYWWRIVKPTVILRCRAQFSSSIVDFATNTNVGKSHSYGSIYSFQTRPQYAACTFSILNRIDIPATQNNSSILNKCVKLSVSSTGSISLQPGSSVTSDQHTQTFSILNRIDLPATMIDAALRAFPPRAFSILNRIDIPATSRLHRCRTSHKNFQYPQPDRYPCNPNSWLKRINRKLLSVSSTGSISLQLQKTPVVA